MKTRISIISVALLAFASTAFAQSTVTGTLSSGASGSSTLSGTVGTSSGSTLTGTVTGGGVLSPQVSVAGMDHRFDRIMFISQGTGGTALYFESGSARNSVARSRFLATTI